MSLKTSNYRMMRAPQNEATRGSFVELQKTEPRVWIHPASCSVNNLVSDVGNGLLLALLALLCQQALGKQPA